MMSQGKNQLEYFFAMGSRKKQWSQEEEKMLFTFHKEYGNKWAVIAGMMPGKDDSCIKNKFYSTLRKGLRKINNYISNIKKKTDPIKYKAFKPFPELFLTKVIAVVDQNFDEKFEVKPRAIQLSSCSESIMEGIQERIAQLAFSDKEYLKPQLQSYAFEQELLSHIQQFNKNCKKRKGKRKHVDAKEQASIDEDSPFVAEKMEQSQLIDQLKEPPKQVKKQSISRTKKTEENNSQTDTKGCIPALEQALPVSSITIPIPLSSSMQKRRSVSTTVISNDSAQFAFMAGQFFKVMEDNSIQQSNNLSVSSSWISQSHIQKGRYMLHPSPLPSSDTYSPFNLNNRNVTLSSQLDDKTYNSIDLFSSGRLQNKKQYNVVSLLDDIPHYEASRANFLVRSSDIHSSQKLAESGNCRDSVTSASLFEAKLKNDYSLNQFLAGLDVKNFKGMPIEDKMNEYEFGQKVWSAKTEGFGHKSEAIEPGCMQKGLMDERGRVGELNQEPS